MVQSLKHGLQCEWKDCSQEPIKDKVEEQDQTPILGGAPQDLSGGPVVDEKLPLGQALAEGQKSSSFFVMVCVADCEGSGEERAGSSRLEGRSPATAAEGAKAGRGNLLPAVRAQTRRSAAPRRAAATAAEAWRLPETDFEMGDGLWKSGLQEGPKMTLVSSVNSSQREVMKTEL